MLILNMCITLLVHWRRWEDFVQATREGSAPVHTPQEDQSIPVDPRSRAGPPANESISDFTACHSVSRTLTTIALVYLLDPHVVSAALVVKQEENVPPLAPRGT